MKWNRVYRIKRRRKIDGYRRENRMISILKKTKWYLGEFGMFD